jgi:hypothetical protein
MIINLTDKWVNLAGKKNKKKLARQKKRLDISIFVKYYRSR